MRAISAKKNESLHAICFFSPNLNEALEISWCGNFRRGALAYNVDPESCGRREWHAADAVAPAQRRQSSKPLSAHRTEDGER